MQLESAVLGALDQLTKKRFATGGVSGHSFLHLIQQAPAPVEVHGTPVVRIHQREIPELGTLIQVGHPRRREVQHRPRERVPETGPRDAPDESFEVVEEAG